MAQKLQQQKDMIAQEMGRDVYEKVSKILLMHKNADSEPEAIHESLKTIMGKNRRMKDLIFSLEMIIFKEN